MKKSKKISIYILLIISIFIFNGQHVYASEVLCEEKKGSYDCDIKDNNIYNAYNPAGELVKYYIINPDDSTKYKCENPNTFLKRRLKKHNRNFSNKITNTFGYVRIEEESGSCNYEFYRTDSRSGKCWNIEKDDDVDFIENQIQTSDALDMFGALISDRANYGCHHDSKKQKYVWGRYIDTNGISFEKTIKDDKTCNYLNDKHICVKCYDGNGNSSYGLAIGIAPSYCAKVSDKFCNESSSDDDPNSTEIPTIYPGGSSNCGITFMQLGCKEDYVKDFQNKLNAVQNCGLDVDGSFGNKTAQCVMSFQKDNGLESNGVADSKTIDKLNSKYTELQTKNDDANLEYHKLVFNTNGGTFANGETTRTVWYLKDENTLSPATIPGKKGYKFLGWYNGSVKYTFGNKLTSDVTLTAKYEKSTTTKICEDGDVLDIDNNQCIKVQDFADQDKNKFYIINNRLLTIQTKFIYTRNCSSDNKYTVTYEKAEGSNNSISCDTEKGYVRDTWRAEDTCQSDKTCPIKDGNNSCQRVYRGTCFAFYDPGDTALGTKPDSDNTYNKDINNNATESPQTGGGIIALIIVTLSIIGLSIFCYKVYNNKKEEV